MAGKPLTVFANASAAAPACGLLFENGQRLPDLKSCLVFVFWSGLTQPRLPCRTAACPNAAYRAVPRFAPTPPICRTAAYPTHLSYRGLPHPPVVPRLTPPICRTAAYPTPFVVPRLDRGIQFAMVGPGVVSIVLHPFYFSAVALAFNQTHRGCHHILALVGKSSIVFAHASAAAPACGLLCENGQRFPS